VDGDDAKKTSIAAVVSLALHAITPLRSDADGGLRSTGPHPKRRGARRQSDGKGTCQTLRRFEDLGTLEEAPHLPLYPAVVWPKTLKRRLRLVVLLHRTDPATPRCSVLGSPDPERNGRTLVERYASRGQMAFLFRDSTQCTGLLAGPARAAAACALHCNASRAPRHLVRAEAWRVQQGQEPPVFSMASWKQGQCNERWLDVCMEKCALDPPWVKNHPCYDELRTYGAIAA